MSMEDEGEGLAEEALAQTLTEVVDRRTGEVVEKTPEDLLLAAKEAAQALERVIKLNERPPLMFNGKRYLEFHHWQVCGKFYHVTTRTLAPVPVEIDGIKGFHAKAEVIDEKTGIIVGGAEAYCMRDEPNWKTKPLYQLASMAQTRAASKALSNKFRFVAIVAGYEGTPSEEMTGDITNGQRQVAMPKSRAVSGPVLEERAVPAESDTRDSAGAGAVGTPSEPRALTAAEEAALMPPVSKFFQTLHKLARDKNVPSEKLKWVIKESYGKSSSKLLSDAECAALIKLIERDALK